MPKPFKTTVEIAGEKHEVEVQPPEGYLDVEEAARLRSSKLQSELLSAAAGKVKGAFLKAGPAGSIPFVNMLQSFFDWDPEHGYFAVVEGRDEEGRPRFRVSAKTEQGRPYMGVTEYLEGWTRDKANADYLTQGRRGTKDTELDGPVIPDNDLRMAGANLEKIASGELIRE